MSRLMYIKGISLQTPKPYLDGAQPRPEPQIKQKIVETIGGVENNY